MLAGAFTWVAEPPVDRLASSHSILGDMKPTSHSHFYQYTKKSPMPAINPDTGSAWGPDNPQSVLPRPARFPAGDQQVDETTYPRGQVALARVHDANRVRRGPVGVQYFHQGAARRSSPVMYVAGESARSRPGRRRASPPSCRCSTGQGLRTGAGLLQCQSAKAWLSRPRGRQSCRDHKGRQAPREYLALRGTRAKHR